MITFQSLSYYLFAIFSFLVFKGAKSLSLKKKILFGINIVFIFLFYFYRKKHLILFGGYLCGNYFLIKQLENTGNKKTLATIQMLLNLLFLSFFKYDFFQELTLSIFPYAGILLKPLVFIGISFFTFRTTSLVFDILYGTLKRKVDFFHYINFVMFFPCFLSGPLDRYERFVNDIESEERIDAKRIYEAVSRIILGAFKKAVIADSLYSLSNASFHAIEIENLNFFQLMIGQYIYYIVLYMDFSGYSDIAIGISNLFGVRTPENFNHPYRARNMQEFWNSWHISFLHWLRDYIYYPIQTLLVKQGFKQFTAIACFAYFFTFLIAGVWHGDTWYYTWYGLSHGISFSIFLIYKSLIDKKLSKEQRKKYKKSSVVKFFAQLITFHYFLFSLFFFINKSNFFTIMIKRIFN